MGDPAAFGEGAGKLAAPGGPPAEPRAWRRAVLRIAGSALFLALLLWLVPLDQLARAFRRIPVPVWGLALGGYLGLHLIGVAKWRFLMRVAGADLPFSRALRCYYSGLFGNTFLPSVVGGDLVRATLALRLGGPPSGVLTGSLVDRFVDVLGLAALAGAGALLAPSALDERSRAVFAGVAALLSIAAASLGLALWILPASRVPGAVRRRLRGAQRSLATLADRPSALGIALVGAVALQTLLVVLNAALAKAMAVDVPFTTWLFVWPLAKIAALLPITLGGIGVRETAQVALLAPFGVPLVDAVAVGLAFQAVVVGSGLVAGAIALILGRTA